MTPEPVRYNPYLPDFAADPYRQYRALRDHDPVHRSFMGTWVLSRYRDVRQVLTDGRFSSELRNWEGFRRRYRGHRSVAWLLNRSVLNIDPPHHTRIKKALAGAFDAGERAALEAVLRRVVDERIAAIRSGGDTFDAIAEFALPIPLRVISHLFRLSADEQGIVKRWSNDVAGLIEPLPTGAALAGAERSIVAFRSWLRGRLEGGNDDDSLPCRIGRLVQSGAMDEDDALANLTLLFPAGHETTIHLIGNGLVTLLRHPDQLARLRADPSLTDTAIEEILRYEPPQQVAWRSALEDCEIGGRTIRKGEQIMLLIGAANRDPEAFGDPEGFDIARKPNPHLAFGSGRHACLGAWFARLQGRIAVKSFLDAFPETRLAGEPEWFPTMSFHGVKSLPVRVSARHGTGPATASRGRSAGRAISPLDSAGGSARQWRRRFPTGPNQ